ncbi:BAG domain-containing protein Samui isoform X2 [Chelonus insularis]|uniref:BAG domain-containing protein Samui isoform X2 n=1 Tax=Chelonus insularis TaxID=460826 RepID=UPI0015885FFB|nr:BAG domain-containing protein Samui isoform X2 [Chelonus insularis]
MSHFFRENPSFRDKFQGNSEDDFLQKFRQHFDDKVFDPISRNSRDSKGFNDKLKDHFDDNFLSKLKQHFDDDKNFESIPKNARDPFERHSTFSKGFPFDDEGFSRRSDIRSHLDDLAARHPEFAEHLLGPPWGDIPFHGTLRNRRRGSSSNSHQGHTDDDTRSQASGSSAASVASGASGVSSHGEPDHTYQQDTSTKIPQYGLRNTVDIGQHHHNMENVEKGDRSQRSMSAPPENRQQPQEQSQQPSQAKQQQSSQQAQQQKNQTQGNVRHIPIFVEGRDEPVIPKNIDDQPTYTRHQSPSRFYQQSNFDAPQNFRNNSHKSSQFNDFFNKRHRDWPSQFQDPFQDTFDHPETRRTHQQSRSPFRQQTTEKQRVPQRDESPIPVPVQKQQQHQETESKQRPTPKTSLEKVAAVQKEVDSLTEQVKQWNGNSRKDKQYIYLDEMLTRELIKLDDIETEGKENVRQARKNAIKSIQDSISLLESKAPLPAQNNETIVDQSITENQTEKQQDSVESQQIMSSNEEQENKEVIPLPMLSTDSSSEAVEGSETQKGATPTEEKLSEDQSLPQSDVASAPIENVSVKDSNETEVQPNSEAQKVSENEQVNLKSSKDSTERKDHQNTLQKKSPKKLKKANQPTPISLEPIPLPASEKQS